MVRALFFLHRLVLFGQILPGGNVQDHLLGLGAEAVAALLLENGDDFELFSRIREAIDEPISQVLNIRLIENILSLNKPEDLHQCFEVRGVLVFNNLLRLFLAYLFLLATMNIKRHSLSDTRLLSLAVQEVLEALNLCVPNLHVLIEALVDDPVREDLQL